MHKIGNKEIDQIMVKPTVNGQPTKAELEGFK